MSTEPVSPYLTIDEAAQVAHCEHRTIRRAIHAGALRAAYGGRWLIDQQDLHEWLRDRGQQRLGQPDAPRRARPTPRPRGAEQSGSVARLKALESTRSE